MPAESLPYSHNGHMSAATALVLVGLVVALAGVGVALWAHLRAPEPAGFAPEDVVVAHGFEQLADAVRRIDARVRLGVVGLLVAGLGAYVGSDARALGADLGGGGTSDKARVGGTW